MTSPFKFLDSYTLADRDIFFGRDQEITELYRRVFESKMLLVYGISGTGKSSLVNCGLASRFDDSDWLPVNVRRGNNIVNSLNEAISKQAITSLNKSRTFEEKLQSVYLDHFKPIYLIFDQFEELFIFGTRHEKTEFIKLIKEVLESKTQCRIIFIIREEFLAGITEFEYDLPEIFSNRFRVEKMKRANAIHAIDGPCKVHNIETEQGFSEELIDKLCPAGNEIELTYLQIYLDRILRLASDENQASHGETDLNSRNYPPFRGDTGGLIFTKSLLALAGNVSDLLGQFLEEQIREFEDPDTGMAILKSFVSGEGTKRQITEPEIIDSLNTFGKSISEPDLLKYLTKFVDLRILRERDETGHFELRHDALAAKIFEKFTIQEKELIEVRLFVENALQAFNARKTYLNRDDLDYLSTYEKRLFLSPALSNFVKESKDKLYAQQRALNRLTTIVAIIFLVIAMAGVQYYLNKKSNIDIKELTTLALLQEKVDPVTSISTAFKLRQKDTVSTVIQGIILNSFYSLLQKKFTSSATSLPVELIAGTIPVKGKVLSMQLNKSGNYLYGWTDRMEVFIRGVNDTMIKSFKSENEIVTVEMSDNTRYLAIVYKNSRGAVYTTDGRKHFDFKTTVNHLMNNRLVRFFPHGNYFMAAVINNNAMIYDSAGAILFDLVGHSGRVNSLDISPDGRFVVTASSDRTCIVWNYNHETSMFSPYNPLIRHKDTVWSCQFNSTGKWILTSSADSMLHIWSLHGNARNVGYAFGFNNPKGLLVWWPYYDPRISEFCPYIESFSAYYKKISDARFASGDRAIIAVNYSYDKTGNGNHDSLFRAKVMYIGWENEQPDRSTNPYISLVKHKSDTIHYETLRMLEISADRKIVAAVTTHNENIILIATDGYQLLSLPGIFPQFSEDGRCLYYLKNKSIFCLPLNPKDIYNYVFEKKIFGKPEIANDIFKII